MVQDETLSRRHFVITRQGESYVLKDLDSRNGTWVDGQRADNQAVRLNHHDCIAAGRSLFMFKAARAWEVARARPATR